MYILKKKIFTLVFLLVLFIYSAANLIHSKEVLQDKLIANIHISVSNLTDTAQELEQSINESVLGRMDYIELYGLLQRLMNKKEISNFAYLKDEKGYLHYSSFFREDDPDIFEYAMRIKRLGDYSRKLGTKIIFVTAPSKYISGVTKLEPGLSANDPSITVERLLFYLNRLGIETLNLGEYIPNNDLSYEDSFFKTDHHWTIPAAFRAAQILTKKMNDSFNAGLNTDFFSSEKYTEKIYKGGMLGSMGRKTGVNYVGFDDFTALWPTFEMHYTRDCLEENDTYTHREGITEETLMIPSSIEKKENIYKDSQYSLYLNGLRPFESIKNNDCPNGPTALFIRDSYFSPVICFMAPVFSRIDAIWSLETSDLINIEQYVRDNKFDYIIIEMYPYNIEDDAFNYFKEEQ